MNCIWIRYFVAVGLCGICIVVDSAVAQDASGTEPELTNDEMDYVIRAMRNRKVEEPPKSRDPLPFPRVPSQTGNAATNQRSLEQPLDAVYQTPRRVGQAAAAELIQVQTSDAVPPPVAPAPPQPTSELRRKIENSLSSVIDRLRFAAEKSAEGARTMMGDVASELSMEAFSFTHLERGTQTAPHFDALVEADKQSRGGGAMDSPQLQRLSREMSRIHVPAPAVGGDFRSQGVKIQLDEPALYQVFRQQGLGESLRAIEKLEDELMNAADIEQAGRALDAFTGQRQAEFLKSAMTFRRSEHLRLVSLRQLVERLAKYESDWSDRPDELKQIAGVTRIRGFYRQQDPADLLLVGEVQAGDPPMLVDDLIVGLRASWKEARVPGCSIDPDAANNFIGYSRVFGVPRNCSFAATMLEADFIMKLVLIAHPDHRLNIPDFDVIDLNFATFADNVSAENRFWLVPVQPEARFILLGPRGESALFESRVQVLTEAMNHDEGLGKANPGTQKLVDAFNAAYDAIAERRPIFKQLNGLFDIVWLGTMLRYLDVRDENLERLVKLPHEILAVPTSFPSADVRLERDGHVIFYKGGCRIGLRSGTRRAIGSRHATNDAIAQIGSLQNQLFVDLGAAELPTLLSRATGESRADLEFDSGRDAYGKKNFEKAIAHFTNAINADPSFAEAYGERAWAHWRAGHSRAAIRDGLAAMTLDPGNSDWVAVVGRVVSDKRSLASLGLDAASQEELAQLLMLEANSALQRGEFEAVAETCSSILTMSPQHTAALLLRSTAHRKLGKLSDSIRDLDQLVALDPSPDYRALRVVSLLLLDLVAEGIDELEQVAARVPDHSWVRILVPQLTLAVRDGDAAIKEVVEMYLNLPPEMLSAYLAALDAERNADPAREVAELDRIRTLSASWGAERKTAAAEFLARVDHELLVALARQVSATAAGPARDRLSQRMAEFAKQLRDEHPNWTAPLYYHARALFVVGDFEAALRTLDESTAQDKPLDPVLSRWLGRNADEYYTLAHFLKVQHLWKHGQLDACRLTLEPMCLEERFSPTVRAASRGLLYLIERRAELKFLPTLPDATMSDITREFNRVFAFWDDNLPAADGLMLAMFLEGYVTVTARGSRPAEADDAAAVLFSRRFGYVESSCFATLLGAMRGAACRELWHRYLYEMQADANLLAEFRSLRSAVGDRRNRVVAAVHQAFVPWRQRAERIGEPALRWAIDETIRLTIAEQQSNFTAGENTLKALATAVETSSESGRPPPLTSGPLARRPSATSATDVAAQTGVAYRRAFTLAKVQALDATLAWFRELAPNRAAMYAAPRFDAPGSTWPAINLSNMAQDYYRWLERDATAQLAAAPRNDYQLGRLIRASRRLEKLDAAFAACDRLLLVQPKSDLPLLYRADLRYRSGQYAEALADLDRLTSKAYTNHLRAKCHLALKNWDAALAIQFQILASYPGDFVTRLDAAEALLQLQRHKEALRQVNEVLRFNSHWPRALAIRAQVEYATGDFVSAVTDWRQLLERDPDFQNARFFRAQAQAHLAVTAPDAERQRLWLEVQADVREALRIAADTWEHRAAAERLLAEATAQSP